MSTATSSPAPASTGDNSRRTAVRDLLSSDRPYGVLLALIALVIFFSIKSDVFFTGANLENIGRQTTLVTIMAVGMTFIIISAEIDLSVASILKLSCVSAALFMNDFSDNWALGALVGIGVGALIGLVNGLLTTKLGIPSFLVTLGMLGVAKGIAFVITDTAPVLVDNRTFWAVFYEGTIAGIPVPIVWTLIALAIGSVLLHLSTFGRKVYATGGNATAARYSGINTDRTKILCFVLTGVLAGLASLIFTAQGHAARPDFADGLELDVIAAVILGGTSLFGGRGTIIGTLIGSLIIGVLNNGLVLIGVSSSWQIAVKGFIIILAVALSKRR
ncbi:ABC transporter permease [Nocardioides aquiterrae]|uniref:ABC transporter permease n=1 Tax=Nocardioides aquiterrae TaxID=203799 RepID=A0ABN1UC28_9ACTN